MHDEDDEKLGTLPPDHLSEDVSPPVFAMVALLILVVTVAVFALLEVWP